MAGGKQRPKGFLEHFLSTETLEFKRNALTDTIISQVGDVNRAGMALARDQVPVLMIPMGDVNADHQAGIKMIKSVTEMLLVARDIYNLCGQVLIMHDLVSDLTPKRPANGFNAQGLHFF